MTRLAIDDRIRNGGGYGDRFDRWQILTACLDQWGTRGGLAGNDLGNSRRQTKPGHFLKPFIDAPGPIATTNRKENLVWSPSAQLVEDLICHRLIPFHAERITKRPATDARGVPLRNIPTVFPP